MRTLAFFAAMSALAPMGCGKIAECSKVIASINAGATQIKAAGDDAAGVKQAAEAADRAAEDLAKIKVGTKELKGYCEEYQAMCKEFAKTGRDVSTMLEKKEALEKKDEELKDRHDKALEKLTTARDEIISMCNVRAPPRDCYNVTELSGGNIYLKGGRKFPDEIEEQADAFEKMSTLMKTAKVKNASLKEHVDGLVKQLDELANVTREYTKGMKEAKDLQEKGQQAKNSLQGVSGKEDAIVAKINGFCGRK